ncbi:uncharacterized protein B0H18DRAFT_1210814 [Fomitopsis serialis]|uniref:uncharacterized protein n=1 Tax=Fomitopsis serialis TaxID=139415 RepID=UPI0020072A77|nr:uncharacterized protein B0H18DRAFT_1210814 [Neoantrodia serialis]KAH9926902.1 hypothetical protein B0H18DRAFT_1210814 [Neoantrodia serialis]
MSAAYSVHKILFLEKSPRDMRGSMQQMTFTLGVSIALILTLGLAAVAAVLRLHRYIASKYLRGKRIGLETSAGFDAGQELVFSESGRLSCYYWSASEIAPETLVLPTIFGRLPILPFPLLLSARALVCWDLVVYNSRKGTVNFVPLATFWRRSAVQHLKKEKPVAPSRVSGSLCISTCPKVASGDSLKREDGTRHAANADSVCADTLAEATSSLDSLSVQPPSLATEALHIDPSVKVPGPICVTLVPSEQSRRRSPRKKTASPNLNRNQQGASSQAASPSTPSASQGTKATPVRRLKTASVEFVLFLAWKVISQKRVVPRPRRRFRPSREFLQRIVRQHVKHNARIAASGATPQSRKVSASLVMPCKPSAPVPGPSPKKAELVIAAPPAVSLPAPAPAADPQLSRNNLLKPSPTTSIRGKQLYGARKSLRSQPLRVPRGQPTPSGRSDPFSSNASTESMRLDLRFSKLGDSVRRKDPLSPRMLIAAHARFGAPAPCSP